MHKYLIAIALIAFGCQQKKELTPKEALEQHYKEVADSMNLEGNLINANLKAKVDSAQIDKNYFLSTLYFGMTEREYQDSLNGFYNYNSSQQLIMQFNGEEVLFTIKPEFNEGYLQSVLLTSVPLEFGINVNLKKESFDDIMFKHTFFSLPYNTTAQLHSLIDFYKSKYGNPKITEAISTFCPLVPNITKYVNWVAEFNRSDKSDRDNKEDSLTKYSKIISGGIQQVLKISTYEFENSVKGNIIKVIVYNRISMEKIKLSKDDFNETKLQRISVEYIPRQAVELRRIDTPMKDSLEKMENDGKKTMDKKIEKATKEVF